MCIYLTLLNCTLKDGKFYSTWLFPQLTIFLNKNCSYNCLLETFSWLTFTFSLYKICLLCLEPSSKYLSSPTSSAPDKSLLVLPDGFSDLPPLCCRGPYIYPTGALMLSSCCPFSVSVHTKRLWRPPTPVLQHPSSLHFWRPACCPSQVARHPSEPSAVLKKVSVGFYFFHFILPEMNVSPVYTIWFFCLPFLESLSSVNCLPWPGHVLTNLRLSNFILLILLSHGCWIPKLFINMISLWQYGGWPAEVE